MSLTFSKPIAFPHSHCMPYLIFLFGVRGTSKFVMTIFEALVNLKSKLLVIFFLSIVGIFLRYVLRNPSVIHAAAWFSKKGKEVQEN